MFVYFFDKMYLYIYRHPTVFYNFWIHWNDVKNIKRWFNVTIWLNLTSKKCIIYKRYKKFNITCGFPTAYLCSMDNMRICKWLWKMLFRFETIKISSFQKIKGSCSHLCRSSLFQQCSIVFRSEDHTAHLFVVQFQLQICSQIDLLIQILNHQGF